MYIFTRTARLALGRNRDAMSWAMGITEQVNHVTELEVSLWTTMFSPAVGQLTWSTLVEDLTHLEASMSKLATEERFLAESDRGAAFTTAAGVDDRLGQLIGSTPDPTRRPQCSAVVTATLANGALARGMEVGVEIAERATAIAGIPTTFVVGMTGPYGGVGWITGAESIRELEAAEQAVNTDADLIAFLDREAVEVFQPGAEQHILRRLL